MIETRYQASTRLAVYGTLAPGRANYHRLEGLKGQWSEGWVRGSLHPTGWGFIHGYPALRWNPGGEDVRVWVLSSADLPQRWAELDTFEGHEYVRGLVQVFTTAGFGCVANIFLAREVK